MTHMTKEATVVDSTYEQTITAAKGLLYDQIRDPAEENAEYTRGIVELIADVHFGTMEAKGRVARDLGVSVT